MNKLRLLLPLSPMRDSPVGKLMRRILETIQGFSLMMLGWPPVKLLWG